MPLAPRDDSQRWTYADYLTWPDDQRWEIIDGVAYAMSSASGSRHQEVSVELTRQFANHLKGKSCKIITAPFDVRLPQPADFKDEKIETVVQPDIVVVCDRDKLDERGYNGVPDLIIEITSPSTGRNDLTIKFDLYQQHGVKEYWIVHPAEQTVLVFKRGEDQTYGKPERYADDHKVAVPLLGDLVIDLADVFAE